jgi:hypothetical protein
MRNFLFGHSEKVRLGAEEAQELEGDAAMVVAEEQRTGK